MTEEKEVAVFWDELSIDERKQVLKEINKRYDWSFSWEMIRKPFQDLQDMDQNEIDQNKISSYYKDVIEPQKGKQQTKFDGRIEEQVVTKKKKGMIIAHFILVITIIFLIIDISFWIYGDYKIGEQGNYVDEMRQHYEDVDFANFVASSNMHFQYQKDAVIMSLFDNITTAYPFLQAQGKILLDYVPILINNISMEDYNKVNDQYKLCLLLDKYVVENRTKYLERIESNYSEIIYYGEFEDTMFYHDTPASKAERIQTDWYLVIDYSIDLKHIGMKLDFIDGIMNEVKNG